MPAMFWFQDEQGWHAGLFLSGLALSLKLTLWSFLVAILLGIPVGIAQSVKLYPLRVFADSYVSIIRNTPPIITVFIVYYFFLAAFFSSPNWSNLHPIFSTIWIAPRLLLPFFAGCISLGLYESAYIAKIIHAGIASLPGGQREAGLSLGLSEYKVYKTIILPQALRKTIPPLTGQLISTLKDSSIISIISIPELTKRGNDIQKITKQSFETWLIVAAMYFLVAFLASIALEAYYKRVRRGF